jgi:hypothetical protein
MTSVEMKFMGRSAKYRWQDYKTNGDSLLEIKINLFLEIFKITEINAYKFFANGQRQTGTLNYEISTTW